MANGPVRSLTTALDISRTIMVDRIPIMGEILGKTMVPLTITKVITKVRVEKATTMVVRVLTRDICSHARSYKLTKVGKVRVGEKDLTKEVKGAKVSPPHSRTNRGAKGHIQGPDVSLAVW